MQRLDGGVTAPKGFLATGVRSGIKQEGLDLAIIVSEIQAVCAGLFTTNAVKAAPVLVSAERAKSGHARAIVVNSGNANACTGQKGLQDATRMAGLAAEALKMDDETEVLVCSTGVIGHFLPMSKIEMGIAEAATNLAYDGGPLAARAIMTTDTRPKMVAYEFRIGGNIVKIGGITKGSGMICPNVATMLCFITTDVAITPELLHSSLVKAAEISVNSLTVDGDMSTNDTTIALANGMSGMRTITSEGPELDAFQKALDQVMMELAREMARDGEGATKLVDVVVKGAESYADAKAAAMTIANSPLVKTAIFGEDPNWGRVLAAAGRSGAKMDPAKVDLYFGDVKIMQDGAPLDIDPEAARKPMLLPELVITVDLKLGDGESRVFTCDFSYDYVKINAEYHT